MDMKLPADFERVQAFRQLAGALGGGIDWAEAMAVVVWVKLWVAMAYQAAENNEPGRFVWTPGLLGKMEGVSEEDLIGMLTRGPFPLLVEKSEKEGSETPEARRTQRGEGQAREFYCERFGKLNGHLAGNYMSKERKGAAVSAVKRAEQNVAARALAQASLLPRTIYRDSAGAHLSSEEVRRVMVLIGGLDNIVRSPARQNSQYGEGLIADAAGVVKEYDEDQVKTFLEWVAVELARGSAVVPRRTEEVLKGWRGLYGGMRLL